MTEGISSNQAILLRWEGIIGTHHYYFINSDVLGVYQTSLLAPSRHWLIHPLSGGAMELTGAVIIHFTDGRAEAWRMRPPSLGRNKHITCFF